MDSAGTIARQTILYYLRTSRAADRFPPRSPPPIVEAKVRDTIQSWKLDIPEHLYEKYIVAGLDIGYAAYQHTSYDLQIAISLFTFCATVVDDATLVDPQALREFIPRFCTGQPQLQPVLTHFVETTTAMRTFFPSYAANTFYSALVSYVNEEIYCRNEATELVIGPDGGQYVEYSRFKGGIPEPYALSIWPQDICPNVKEYIQAVPDAIVFINGLNDLFSFYKETLEDDQHNYIHQYARVYGKTLEESVDDLAHKLVSSIERVRNILGEGKALEAWENFVSGYTHFHLYCPRYKLSKIVPEYF
ncbi:hypothetical protein QCA50_006456 [Cerrena zonata]|uniref:Terpenoid synthase n=1 Tax=Cerrena zonata TaxID=2478898 RepID=A0AAW0GIT7_9APHY